MKQPNVGYLSSNIFLAPILQSPRRADMQVLSNASTAGSPHGLQPSPRRYEAKTPTKNPVQSSPQQQGLQIFARNCNVKVISEF